MTRLELYGMWPHHGFLDLSSGPKLEDLEITRCGLMSSGKVSSPSLKRLVIRECNSSERIRAWISAPSLVFLRLECTSIGRVPVLERLPELGPVWIHPDSSNSSNASYNAADSQEDSDEDIIEDMERCVLLEGLAHAKNLAIISNDTTYIFRRDLRWCPTFSKLKTLLLNEYWCEPTGCRALACILEHAPVLEKLTVLLSCKVQCKYKVEIRGRLDPVERSARISEHLKIVEVKSDAVNEKVVDVLNFLGTVNISTSERKKDMKKHLPIIKAMEDKPIRENGEKSCCKIGFSSEE
ncbi:hypothetical protein ACP70R_011096 [Stipagrostis hirtigluma subsp. patula]